MKSVLLLLLCLVTLTGCVKSKPQSIDTTTPPVHEEMNSVYYWKTTLKLDSTERDFLKHHNVNRAYVRFFDVVADTSAMATAEVIPNATIIFEDTIPVKEIVPTVYITQDAMRRMEGHENSWGPTIVQRIRNMCSYNDLGTLKEIQLDCDWTAKTRESFFNLCRAVKKSVTEYDSTAIVSATIRLHQLSQEAPPVDYAVLMIYNTGDFQNPQERNSILSVENVEPYLRKLPDYPLHLDFAFPSYSWDLLFKDNIFIGILRQGRPLQPGETIRRETSDFRTLSRVKTLIDDANEKKPHSSILYHLDSANLSNYTDDEIKNLYR